VSSNEDTEDEPLSTGWFREGPGKVDVGDFNTLSFADAAFIATAVNYVRAALSPAASPSEPKGSTND
jgi:hypothetical protein